MRRILPISLPITVALTLAMAAAATAAPRTSGPVSDRFIRASTRPASTRPATAPAAAVDETGVNPAASEFLRAVSAGEYERVYQLTTADYREGRPLEDFKKEMDKLRAELDVRRMRFQVFAAPRPAAGGKPWRAIAIWPTSRKSNRKSVSVGLGLTLVEGAWRVDHVELVEDIVRPGQGFVAGFMKAHPGARPVASAGAGMMTLSGRVTRVDGKSVTIEPTARDKAGPAAAERTLAVDEDTRVFVPVREGQRKSATGRTIPNIRAVPGKLADVKVGQQVEVEILPGKDVATRIMLDPAHAEEGL